MLNDRINSKKDKFKLNNSEMEFNKKLNDLKNINMNNWKLGFETESVNVIKSMAS